MHVTFVKKVGAEGEACRKCADVEHRLRKNGYWASIDTVLIADERNTGGDGVALAAILRVDRAPFFVVEDDHGDTTVYTIYFKFVREVLEQMTTASPTYEPASA